MIRIIRITLVQLIIMIGEFVLTWNMDDVASPALGRFLASGSLRADAFYTASYHIMLYDSIVCYNIL